MSGVCVPAGDCKATVSLCVCIFRDDGSKHLLTHANRDSEQNEESDWDKVAGMCSHLTPEGEDGDRFERTFAWEQMSKRR